MKRQGIYKDDLANLEVVVTWTLYSHIGNHITAFVISHMHKPRREDLKISHRAFSIHCIVMIWVLANFGFTPAQTDVMTCSYITSKICNTQCIFPMYHGSYFYKASLPLQARFTTLLLSFFVFLSCRMQRGLCHTEPTSWEEIKPSGKI